MKMELNIGMRENLCLFYSMQNGKILKIIEKAMIACKNSEISVKDCFTDVSKPIISGKEKEEFIEDLPTPKKSLKQLEKENKIKSLKN